jgi:hypothetical protein
LTTLGWRAMQHKCKKVSCDARVAHDGYRCGGRHCACVQLVHVRWLGIAVTCCMCSQPVLW